MLYQIKTPNLCGGIVTKNKYVKETAPVFRWMIGKSLSFIIKYCKEKKYKLKKIKEKKITKFSGEHRFLSNFYLTEVRYKNLTYTNSESAYQASKTLDKKIRKKFTTLNPYDAKKAGRLLTLRPNWDYIKRKVMYNIVKAKFTQNKKLLKKLIETGDSELEETTFYWHDTYWGICNGKGSNVLGYILMKVRKELQTR